MEKSQSRSRVEDLLQKETPWLSIWTTAFMLFLTGLQMSIYFTSTWQYMKETDPNCSMNEFGWVMAACSLACAIANPLFGYWNQKTNSTKQPLTVGFTLCAIGNMMYGLLPFFSEYVAAATLFSRFLTGFGAGTLGVLRGFIATASVKKDRMRAVSLGTACFTAGLAIGPGIQICFLPLGKGGFYFASVLINMYTGAAFLMCLVSLISVLMANIFLKENYAGIISDEDKKVDPFLVIPQFDRYAVAILFFYWWILTGVASTEGLAAPITMAMYNWSSEEAVLYNGIIQSVSCLWSTVAYLTIGTTRIGRWDRRWQLCLGLSLFLFFHSVHFPWPVYNGPLDRTPIVNGTVMDDMGGCSWSYDWCDYTKRVPLWMYLIGFGVVQGWSYPFVSAPCNTLLSEMLGPRKQGMAQGMFAFTGSMAQVLVPIASTNVYEGSGYKYIMLYHMSLCAIALLLLLLLRKRLVPLNLSPQLEVPTRYKRGIFYRM